MLSVLFNKSLQTDPFLINDFSRVAPLISIKLNGAPNASRNKSKNIVMAERRNESYTNKNNDNNYSNIRTVVTSRLSGLPNSRRQNKNRTEESICPSVGNVVQFNNFTVGLPLRQPLQPQIYNHLAYQQFVHAVLQPNLQPCFHRPNQENRRQLHNAAGRRSLKGLRFWEKISPNSTNSGFVFSVMTYNVLAQDLINQHPYLYTFHRRDCLKWDTRWNNLLAEIRDLNPDILCLQEVQNTHLDQYFSTFETLGYQGLYKQRTGPRTDGCAIYYKSSLLTLLEHETVEYNQPSTRLLDRDNVAIIAKFAPKSHLSHSFVVATTHLLYNPKRQDVRLAQTQLLLAEIDRIAFNSSKYFPVIVTGDLNSTPNSALYKFITSGLLRREDLASIHSPRSETGTYRLPSSLRITDECQHADLLAKRQKNNLLPRQEELKLIELKHSGRQIEGKKNKEKLNEKLFNSGSLSHKFFLDSVYKYRIRGDIEATTFQDMWVSVDYIFFSKKRKSKSGLVLLERYRLPTSKELRDLKIPNGDLGSDHLSLMARFKLELR
ncbi:protein angel homolog 2 isoform X2 [Tribolium madens]|uniref:protein angel homolog 2 isoform X2 n=1 Tax=Tribolium madens TaxID=41895 RepID=UPI001CF75AFA|nr:protein angel homolog 2 isoform X2 [Tribolium madens]